MRITILLATLTLTGTLTLFARDTNPPGTMQEQSTAASSNADTLTGCLKGSKHQYYVVEADGTRHTVTAKNQDLGSYVNHKVTLTGKADTSRNAAASDAEGHRTGYFSVDSVSDQGSCKK